MHKFQAKCNFPPDIARIEHQLYNISSADHLIQCSRLRSVRSPLTSAPHYHYTRYSIEKGADMTLPLPLKNQFQGARWRLPVDQRASSPLRFCTPGARGRSSDEHPNDPKPAVCGRRCRRRRLALTNRPCAHTCRQKSRKRESRALILISIFISMDIISPDRTVKPKLPQIWPIPDSTTWV